MMQALQAAFEVNGTLLILACTAAALLLPARAHVPALPAAFAPAAFLLYGALAIAYLLYPNYSDYAGPAMTAVGEALLEGRPVYPPLSDYSFHGMLYGPLVAEIQAAGLYLGAALGGLPVMLSSKLPGVLAFLAAGALLFTMARGLPFAGIYFVLLLMPFQIVAFWNRCEPFLVLLSLASLWAAAALPGGRAALAIGACAGLASALKLHACLYIAPALVLLLARDGVAPGLLVRAALAAAAAFLLCFLPPAVSLPRFFDYLGYAAGHGWSWRMFVVNLAFALVLWCPFVVALPPGGRLRALRDPVLLALAALHVAVAAVGAKPGAGFHHLLPFIPANALIFARRLEASASGLPLGAAVVWLALLAPGIAACAGQAWGMAGNWPIYAGARAELSEIRAKLPGAVMGAAGDATYPYAYLRPELGWRGMPQVEYSAYMDLQLSGVPDAALRAALDGCEIPLLVLPKGEPPFSLTSAYLPGRPLFSDALREAFQRRYSSVAYGAWYEVFACRRPAG